MRNRSWLNKPLLLIAAALGAVVFAPGVTSAQLLDPATLQIGATSPPSGSDPNILGSSGLVDIYQNSGGTGALTNPFLLIVGVADPSSKFALSDSSISSVTSTAGGTTGWQLGGAVPAYITNTKKPDESQVSWNATTGFGGDLTSTSGNAYSVLGFNGTDASNNWTNWSSTDLKDNSITASEFALYVFQITATLGPKDTVSVQFANGALPTGTVAIAYGQTSTKIFDTPFTQAGLTTGTTTAVPAPPSLALLGIGGFCLAGFVIRSRRHQVAVA